MGFKNTSSSSHIAIFITYAHLPLIFVSDSCVSNNLLPITNKVSLLTESNCLYICHISSSCSSDKSSSSFPINLSIVTLKKSANRNNRYPGTVSKEYALDAVAKRIDNRQGDTIDKETIVNAVSTQVKVIVGTKNLLLCGDSSYEAIKNKLSGFSLIQLPHHGKKEQADRIFEQKGSVGITYYVSDNTGNSNGGSDDLPVQGYNIKNTLKGDQECSSNSVGLINAPVRSYYRGD